MNRIMLFVILLFFNGVLFANDKICFEKKNIIKYYYLNGVWVFEEEMAGSIKILKNRMAFSKEIKINELYNPTKYENSLRWTPNSIYSLYLDVQEVFEQKQYELKTLAIDMKSSMKKPIDISLINKLKGRLSPNNNIVFAHSQGNLVAGELCEQMKDKSKLEIISIASPGYKLPCNTYQTYVLYDNDRVIGGLREIKDEYGYLKPNMTKEKFGLLNHELADYLSDPQAITVLKNGLEITQNLIYDKNLNFPVVKTESVGSILDQTICVNDTVSDFHIVQSGFTGQKTNDTGTQCFTLKNKHSFTDKEIKAIELFSLGKSFTQVVASLIQIHDNNPELIQYLPNINYKEFIEPFCKNLKVGTFSYINGHDKKTLKITNEDGIFHVNEINESSNERKIATNPFSIWCTRLKDLNHSNCANVIKYLSN